MNVSLVGVRVVSYGAADGVAAAERIHQAGRLSNQRLPVSNTVIYLVLISVSTPVLWLLFVGS